MEELRNSHPGSPGWEVARGRMQIQSLAQQVDEGSRAQCPRPSEGTHKVADAL